MNFIWKMQESEWKRFMFDMSNNNYDGNNFYGQMYCGDFCVEFLTDYINDNEIIGFVYIYQLYVDTGYGEDKNGIPYDLTDEYFVIPITNTFEEFRRECENAFKDLVIKNNWMQLVKKHCDWTL